MSNYKANIVKSSREFTARESIKVKDTSNAVGIDAALENTERLVITPVDYAVLEVENENSKMGKKYYQYIILDVDGTKYTTGSETFWSNFIDIFEEMASEVKETGEEFKVEVYRKPSKNFEGKYFITCSLL